MQTLSEGTPYTLDPDFIHLMSTAPSGREIVSTALAIAKLLLEKNAAYGDSALNPVRIFARDTDALSQILVRIDDKLSRLQRGSAAGEDVELDLLGYLILLRIARARLESNRGQ